MADGRKSAVGPYVHLYVQTCYTSTYILEAASAQSSTIWIRVPAERKEGIEKLGEGRGGGLSLEDAT